MKSVQYLGKHGIVFDDDLDEKIMVIGFQLPIIFEKLDHRWRKIKAYKMQMQMFHRGPCPFLIFFHVKKTWKNSQPQIFNTAIGMRQKLIDTIKRWLCRSQIKNFDI